MSEDHQITITHLREKLAESQTDLDRHKAAIDRIIAECEVSTDRDFCEHLKSKVAQILSGEHHSVQSKKE